MARRSKKDTVASAAAAAAAAAVKATREEDSKSGMLLNWSTDDDDEDDQELTDEVITGLEKVDEEEGGDVCWWELYCDTPVDKQGQIRKLSTSEMRGLRDECLGYGPGEYHVVARRKNGTFVKGSRLKLRISGFARAANGTFAQTPQPPAIDAMALLERLDARQDQRRREEKAARDQQIKFWAPILAPVGVELAKGLFGRSNGESIKDLVAAMVGMKDLVGGGKNGDVDALLKGMELAREMTPEKGSTWPDMLVNGLRELRPSLESLVTRRNGAAVPAVPVQPVTFRTAQAALPAASPEQLAPGGAQPSQSSDEDPMWAMMRPLLEKLAIELEEYAGNGADPALAAEALLAKVPRMIRNQVTPQQLKEWLTRADWWDVLVKFRPSLQSYQGFCDDVRLTLLQMVEEQLNPTAHPDEEEEGAPG